MEVFELLRLSETSPRWGSKYGEVGVSATTAEKIRLAG